MSSMILPTTRIPSEPSFGDSLADALERLSKAAEERIRNDKVGADGRQEPPLTQPSPSQPSPPIQGSTAGVGLALGAFAVGAILVGNT